MQTRSQTRKNKTRTNYSEIDSLTSNKAAADTSSNYSISSASTYRGPPHLYPSSKPSSYTPKSPEPSCTESEERYLNPNDRPSKKPKINHILTVSPSKSVDIQEAFKKPEESEILDQEEYSSPSKNSGLNFTNKQRGRGLEIGFRHNWSCTPSSYRLSLATEYLEDIRQFEDQRYYLLNQLEDLEQKKAEKLRKIAEIVETQKEELKLDTIGKLQASLSSQETVGPSASFDKTGQELHNFDFVEVDNPYTCTTEEGQVIQVIPNNIALVRLTESKRVIGFFGSDIRVLEEE